MIAINNVSMYFPAHKSFRELLRRPLAHPKRCVALRDINLSFECGDRVALLGPNGAGKTTLLKLVGGLLLPSEGEILVDGLSTVRHNTAARRSVGFVMNEERSFFWRLTGRQNLMFFGALDNLFGRFLSERVTEVVDLLGLQGFIDKPFSHYSSGMRQRLAMARGILPDPDVLILDEPTRTLDPIASEDLIALILQRIHADAEKTLLIATHRLDEAELLCDKVLVIHGGRIASCDEFSRLNIGNITLASYYRRAIEKREPAHG